MKFPKTQAQRRHRGFTLVETALALVIVAIVLLAAIGLLVPAQRAIADVLTADQAARLRAEIEREMTVVRPGENFATGFDKAYNIVNRRDSEAGLLAAFFYRAQKPSVGGGSFTSDGRLTPYTGDIVNARAGEDYVVQAAVMPVAQFESNPGFLDALEGRVFVVRLMPLEGLLPTASESYLRTNADPDGYPEAVIPAAAEFYVAIDSEKPSEMMNQINQGFARTLMVLNIGFNR